MKDIYLGLSGFINLGLFILGIIALIVFALKKTKIYNEAKWIRSLVVAIPFVGRSIDSLLYKKGNDTDWFIAGEDLDSGDNCYLNVSDGKFYKACAKTHETSSTLIVKALQNIKENKKGIFLVRGKYYSHNIKRGLLYLSLEPGRLTNLAPYGTGNVIRIISNGLNEKEEFFNPSSTFITYK